MTENSKEGLIADKIHWNSNNYELIINEDTIPPNLIKSSDLQAEVDDLMPITKKLNLLYESNESLNEDTMNVCMSLTIEGDEK